MVQDTSIDSYHQKIEEGLDTEKETVFRALNHLVVATDSDDIVGA